MSRIAPRRQIGLSVSHEVYNKIVAVAVAEDTTVTSLVSALVIGCFAPESFNSHGLRRYRRTKAEINAGAPLKPMVQRIRRNRQETAPAAPTVAVLEDEAPTPTPPPTPVAPQLTPEEMARQFAANRLNKNYIAARTRLPWDRVEAIMAEVKQRQQMEADSDC